MTEKVALIDYGAGNLHSVYNALCAVGCTPDVTKNPENVTSADRIILPGVGAFAACYAGLSSIDGMIDSLKQRVLMDGVPFLGICVGMQLLADRGIERGTHQGLGWIPGEVRPINPSENVKVPHMGWNDVIPLTEHPVLERGEAYFLHGYHFVVRDEEDVAATTDHGGVMTAAIARDNMIGVQFHPEKSQKFGLELLQNFLDWNPQ